MEEFGYPGMEEKEEMEGDEDGGDWVYLHQ